MTSGTSKTRKPAASTSTPSSSSTTSANGTSSRRKSETKKAATEPRPKRQTSSARKKKEADVVSDEADGDDADELLEKMSADSRKRRNSSKRKRSPDTAILHEFTSLDALLDHDFAERKKKQVRDQKMQQLRDESSGKGGSKVDGSPLIQLMNDMESSMTSLSADSHLFAAELPRSQEKFGYVFTPITEPLPYQRYKATPTELASELGLVYKTMQSNDADELAALLWSQAILIRCCLTKSTSTKHVLPTKIGSWLFTTMATHSDSHIVKGCCSNLFLCLTSMDSSSELGAGLPSACFCLPNESFRALFGTEECSIEMEWEPSVYDFLNAFRTFGFQDSKRSMSAKSKIVVTPKSKAKRTIPFPTLNMQFVLVFLVLCLRTKILRLDGYDAFSFTMFFLRMQFEQNMHPEIVQLASVCIEELLDVFPTLEWRKEWAPSLVLRIAGSNEGLFDSASGWLAVARRLPRTIRGTQLTTGLAMYVLQHRIDKTPIEGATSERPLKFPIQSGLVLDIVAGIVEDLTVKYAEKRKDGRSVKASPPPYDLLCKKVALMDLALQAFLNILTQKEMAILLKKLDQLAGAHKSTMSAKWHELKTLVSLMHRKYSLENLRVGQERSPPAAKLTLFQDDDKVE